MKYYYYCEFCGNTVECIDRYNKTMSCCNHPMKECECNDNDEMYHEKHVPSYIIENNKICVKIGEIMHPQTKEHHILFIRVDTNKGSYIRNLKADEKPEACFILDEGEEVCGIYAYCNIHGLWRKEIK